MNLTINSTDLQAALTDAAKVVSKKSSLKVLGNVCLRAGRLLTIEATDLSMAFSVNVKASVAGTGAVTVNAHDLLAAVKSFPKGSILTVEAYDEKGTLTLAADGSTTSLETLSADEWPDLHLADKSIPAFDILTGTLRDGLSSVAHAAASDEMRPILRTVVFTLTERGLVLVAADNYRVAERVIYPGRTHNEGLRFLLPIDTVTALRALMSGCALVSVSTMGTAHAVFAWGDKVLVSRVVDGTFPNYEQVIPASPTTTVTMDRLVFLAAVSGASSMATAGIVNLSVADGTVVVHAKSYSGEYTRTIPAYVVGDAMTWAGNWKYLRDLAATLSDQKITFGFGGPLKPALVTADDFRSAIMPVRVSGL